VIDVSRCRPDAAAASRELGSNWHDERLTSGRDGFAAVARSTATRDGEHRFWLHDDGKPFLLLLDGMAAEQVFGPFSASASGDLETTLRFDRFGERVLRMVDAKGEPVAGRVFAVPPRGFAPKFLQTSTAGGYVRSATAEVVDVFLVSDGVSEEATTVRTFDRVARGVRAKNDSTTPDVVVRAELLPDRPTKPVDR
jgi:hypothetical protein